MAKIIDHRTRNEKTIGEGHAFIGSKVNWKPAEDNPGFLSPAGEVFTLGVADVRVELSESELLHVVAQWMTEIARRRCAEELKRDTKK